MRLKSGWVILACMLLAVAPVLATERLVNAATGVDTGDCTAACKTIGYAVTQAVSGDVIRVFPGTYKECVDASAKGLDFIADANQNGNPPSRTVTIIDGTGVCGGMICLDHPATSCLLDSACAGTCVIAEGETEGTCSNLEAACEVDEDCGEPCVGIGHCAAGTCSVTTATACSQATDCPVDETCNVVTGTTVCAKSADCSAGQFCTPLTAISAAIRLGDGSSIEGFTVKGGGDSGVSFSGTTIITMNVITGNGSSYSGGGLAGDVVSSGASAKAVADTQACWGDPTLSCTGAPNCSVCDKNRATECADDTPCAEAEGPCVSLGPCLWYKQATIDNNIITGNAADGDAGGLKVNVVGIYGGGARAVITTNTFDGNTASGRIGESYGIGGAVYTFSLAYYGGLTDASVSENTVKNNVAQAQGGGVASNLWSLYGGANQVAITTNTIDGNSAGGDGGGIIAGLGNYYYGYYSSDQVDITGNTVKDNKAENDGGGMSVQLVRSEYWSIASKGNVASNTVTGNSAKQYGGGIDLYVDSFRGFEYPAPTESRLLASKNTVTGNTAAEFGGGISSWLQSDDSFVIGALRVEQNTIDGNTASMGGGGSFLETDSYGGGEGNVQNKKPKASSDFLTEHWFDNNLVLGNTAGNSDDNAVGGGAFVALYSRSNGFAALGVDFATMQSNRADLGGGGIEVEADTGDGGGGFAGLVISNSIALNNIGYGLGGPDPGGQGTLLDPSAGNLSVVVLYSDSYGNSYGDYERTLTDHIAVPDPDGLTQANPMLNASGVPDICSPTIDAGDPASDYSSEPQPNGFLANMGHLGNTEGAIATLPDVNDDRQVSGIDLVLMTNAFGAEAPIAKIVLPDTRYLLSLDINHDGVIDGDDLAFVAAYYGTDCR